MSDIEVKALEWEYRCDEDGDWLQANTPFHTWSIAFTPKHKLPYVLTPFGLGLDSNYATQDEAKAAAQSDYDARIRSAIEGKAEPVAIPGVDGQILVAAREMDEAQRKQPEWLWYDNNGMSLSLGRWPRYKGCAPYIRADLIPASIMGEATRYAESLARALHEKHYSDVTGWSPLSGDLIGIISQIDNMTAALSTPPAAPVKGEDMRAAFEKWTRPMALDLTMSEDAWGRPIYKHSHIEAMWKGFEAGSALSRPGQGGTQNV